MTKQTTVYSLAIAAVIAGCGARNLIGNVDGGMAGMTAGAGVTGNGGSAGVRAEAGATGASGVGSAGSAGFSGSGPGAGMVGSAGGESPCVPGLYMPAPPNTNGAAGVLGAAGTPFAPPTASTPFPTAPPIDLPVVGRFPVSVAAGDLNGDGKVDLVVGAAVGASVILNKGDGTFRPAVIYDKGGGVAIGDVSGDGKPDIVVASGQNVWLLFNDGKGVFATSTAPINRTLGMHLSYPAITDLDKDGDLDVVVVDVDSGSTNMAMVIRNEGKGTFAMPERFPVGNLVSALVLADLNRDGCPDVIVSNFLDASFTAALNACDGSAALRAPQTWRTGGNTGGIAVGPIDPAADGVDVVVAVENPADVDVFLAKSVAGGFGSPVPYNAGAGSKAVALGDLDGDGHPDAVVGLVGGISVLRNKGDGTFAAPMTALTPCGYRDYTDQIAIALADFDGDGHLDVAETTSAFDKATVFLNRWR